MSAGRESRPAPGIMKAFERAWGGGLILQAPGITLVRCLSGCAEFSINRMLVAAAMLALFANALGGCQTTPQVRATVSMPRVVVSDSGSDFIVSPGGQRFVVWGVNYDHDEVGRLIEDYWETDWAKVVEDFKEIKELGANVVRVHLQFGKFMTDARTPNNASLERLAKLAAMAERRRLYLDLTGLGCYHKADVPPWYDALDEGQRWDAQAVFWAAVARTCKDSPALFCYDLMNEPVIPSEKRPDREWLAAPLGDKHFVQWLILDPAGRDRTAIAKQWVDRMTSAVRSVDRRTMITVGLFVYSGFIPEEACGALDFIAVHEYPHSGKIDGSVRLVKKYDVGKPLVVEEMFPLFCSIEEMDQFIDRTRPFADGWISFYWGGPTPRHDWRSQIMQSVTERWLEYFRAAARQMRTASSATTKSVKDSVSR